MSDFILVEGDLAIFANYFGTAFVAARPGNLTASGSAAINGKKICVEGDESQVKVLGCMYTTPLCCIPGLGTLEISALGGNQKALKTKTGGKAVLLKGGSFTAKFSVDVPAMQPPPGPIPPIPDAMPFYFGNGVFAPTNYMVKGS